MTEEKMQCSSMLCSRDTDCTTHEKCCLSEGRMQCVVPTTDVLVPPLDVQLVCPHFDPSACLFSKPGRAECHSDRECRSSQKCCCADCGWKCVTPVKVKQGRCPFIFATCQLPLSEPTCKSDCDCPGQRKCCDICGKSCWHAEPEPPGTCPRGEEEKHLSCSSVYCSSDADCSRNEKCCISDGGKKCVQSEE
ncbi:hypothetical protein FKM82_024576, partial [Ascaphus truei]